MIRLLIPLVVFGTLLLSPLLLAEKPATIELKVEQLTSGAKHHFFGYKLGKNVTKNHYAFFRRSDGAFARSQGLEKGAYRGDIRIDPSPRWNRTSDAVLVPGITENGTRQMFIIRVITREGASEREALSCSSPFDESHFNAQLQSTRFCSP